jgi:hypothetical protein
MNFMDEILIFGLPNLFLILIREFTYRVIRNKSLETEILVMVGGFGIGRIGR